MANSIVPSNKEMSDEPAITLTRNEAYKWLSPTEENVPVQGAVFRPLNDSDRPGVECEEIIETAAKNGSGTIISKAGEINQTIKSDTKEEGTDTAKEVFRLIQVTDINSSSEGVVEEGF